MATLPQDTGQFTDKDYWSTFFKKRTSAFEWYGNYEDLAIVFERYLKPSDKILQIGCGNSTLADSMHDNGFTNVTSIDTAEQAINKQSKRNKIKRPLLVFEAHDATNLPYCENSFEAIVDKGTLDAMLPDAERLEDYLPTAQAMIDQVMRVLSSESGRYIIVTLAQRHIIQFWVQAFKDKGYIMRVHQVPHSSERDINALKYPVFVLISTKLKVKLGIAQVYDFCYGDNKKGDRLKNVDEIIERIDGAQEFARFCYMCKTSRLSSVTNISMPGSDGNARFNISLIDKSMKSLNSYAVFIVPQGRECEYLFCDPQGQRSLAEQTHAARLAIVCMCRGQIYKNVESIKDELNAFVHMFAPTAAHEQQMNFLSVGEGTGSRILVTQGLSEINGAYVVEDVTIAKENRTEILRRLIFTQSPTLIQSEARIVNGGIDPWTLCCAHHSLMLHSAAFALPDGQKADNYAYDIVIIGVGGGAMPSYMHKLLPKATIEAVDFDVEVINIAEKYFDLKQDERLKCVVNDGIAHMKQIRDEGRKVDILLLDVAGSVQKDGLSCPPPQFVTDEIFNLMAQIINKTGWLALNIVTRDEARFLEIEDRIRYSFPNILKNKVEGEVNTILLCQSHAPMFPQQFAHDLDIKHDVFKKYCKRNANKRNMKV